MTTSSQVTSSANTICQLSKDANSAISRAKSESCKSELSNLACSSDDQLYPSNLPNYCESSKVLDSNHAGHYLGCYSDSFDSRLLGGNVAKLSGTNSPRKCWQMCAQSGFAFAGVQYSYECFCGNETPKKELLLDDIECNSNCSGDPGLKCGGYLTMNVYKTGLLTFKPLKAASDYSNSYTNEARIVFLLTVSGRAVRQVKRLLKRLMYEGNQHYFYIHVDSRQKYMYREMKHLEAQFGNGKIKVAEQRWATIWGGASLLKMLLGCMKDMTWKEWDFVINLSESDYILKRPKQLATFLAANKGRNFVKSHGREPHVFVRKQGLDWTFYECDNHMWRVNKRQLPLGIQVDGGSDWVCLSKEFVTYLVSSPSSSEEEDAGLLTGLKAIFNYTLLPAESFFHTSLRNSRFCSTYVNNNLRLTNWKRSQGCKCQHRAIVDWCGCSPNDFLPSDWSKVNSTRSRQVFFGRKFEPVVSQNIINMLDTWIYPETEMEVEKNDPSWQNYWQNIYHHLDQEDDDDTLIPLSMALSQSSLDKGHKVQDHVAEILQVHSLHKFDQFDSILVQFRTTGKNHVYEAKLKPPDKVALKFTSGHLSVSTGFDPKELLCRNFYQNMGPQSQPTLVYNLEKTSKNGKNGTENVTVLWVDPIGDITSVNKISVNTSAAATVVDSVTLNSNSNLVLRPGIWSVFYIQDSTNSSEKVEFMIIPTTTKTKKIVKSQHSGSSKKSADHQKYSAFVDDKEKKELAKMMEVSEKKPNSEWIRSMADIFYTVQDLCCTTKLVPGTKECSSTEWSSFYPDVKSELPKNY